MKRYILALVAVALAASVATPVVSSASKRHSEVLGFDVMAPVVEPYTGTANPIREVPGGGLPWEIDSAKGELHRDGKLEVEVEGLVLARRAPVPEAQQGTNPIPSFKAIVSCLSATDGAATTVNVSTDLFPATASGDAEIEATVALPSPCFAPIVFVTSPNGAWFSVTGT
ncbi:MAG: hypothetical protein GEU71_06415 [Actinobacteria bacterium]|jgi:hypothetical protein|nr:hypothetical protein [Actinomycetota bacterium]